MQILDLKIMFEIYIEDLSKPRKSLTFKLEPRLAVKEIIFQLNGKIEIKFDSETTVCLGPFENMNPFFHL